jgi:N-acetylhexosamine 1-kinase
MAVDEKGVTSETVGNLLEHFGCNEKAGACRPFGAGHLNKTYETTCDGKKIIVQRINDSVFSPVPALMANISAVLSFVRQQRVVLLATDLAPDVRSALLKLRMPELIPTVSGDLAVYWNNGWWRAYTRVERAVAFNVPPDISYLKSASHLAGVFSCLLRLPGAPDLFDILPGFQMIKSRLERLQAVMERTDVDFRRRAQKTYDRIMELKPVVDRVWRTDAPRFVVHNDLKFNNILFDEVSGEACSVVDLDTCSLGYLFYDFGDFIRAACATNDEDVVEGMGVDLARLKIASSAFLDGIGRASLEDLEKQQCIDAPAAIATALASRFLTDHLEGDIYFAPRYPGHNLVRAEAQIALAESFNSHTAVLEEFFAT